MTAGTLLTYEHWHCTTKSQTFTSLPSFCVSWFTYASELCRTSKAFFICVCQSLVLANEIGDMHHTSPLHTSWNTTHYPLPSTSSWHLWHYVLLLHMMSLGMTWQYSGSFGSSTSLKKNAEISGWFSENRYCRVYGSMSVEITDSSNVHTEAALWLRATFCLFTYLNTSQAVRAEEGSKRE